MRKEIQLAGGDYIDLTQYEPAMHHLIDSYIGAEESRMLANFDDLSLVELLVEKGKDAIKFLPKTYRDTKMRWLKPLKMTCELIEKLANGKCGG